MQKIILCKGCPSSGKSTWAVQEVNKNPDSIVRVNRDSLRVMMNNYHFSESNEKIITSTQSHIMKQALLKGKDVISDNTNINKRNFEDVVKLVKSLNIDCMVMEKHFYIDLQTAIDRDSKREGSAKVGEDVVKKFWKQAGGKQFEFYKPKIEVFKKSYESKDVAPMLQDASLPKAAVFDNDGTISLLNGRNPYDASTCDNDLPHAHVIETLKLYFNAGYKIIFVSGREEKDRAPTERFYKKHFPEVTYELYMRPTGDQRKDVLIKEEIFNSKIKDKYFLSAWFDDRLQICRWAYEIGLPIFRVSDPEATF